LNFGEGVRQRLAIDTDALTYLVRAEGESCIGCGKHWERWHPAHAVYDGTFKADARIGVLCPACFGLPAGELWASLRQTASTLRARAEQLERLAVAPVWRDNLLRIPMGYLADLPEGPIQDIPELIQWLVPCLPSVASNREPKIDGSVESASWTPHRLTLIVSDSRGLESGYSTRVYLYRSHSTELRGGACHRSSKTS